MRAGLTPGDHVVTVLVGLWDGDLKVAVTGVRDGRASAADARSPPDSELPLNVGIPGDRVRSGLFDPRMLSYSVGADGKMLLRFTGQAVGPRLNVNNLALAWLVLFVAGLQSECWIVR